MVLTKKKKLNETKNVYHLSFLGVRVVLSAACLAPLRPWRLWNHCLSVPTVQAASLCALASQRNRWRPSPRQWRTSSLSSQSSQISEVAWRRSETKKPWWVLILCLVFDMSGKYHGSGWHYRQIINKPICTHIHVIQKDKTIRRNSQIKVSQYKGINSVCMLLFTVL